MCSAALVDRWIDSVIRHHADAVIFKAHDRPRFYVDGRSMPIAQCAAALTEGQVPAIAQALMPARLLEGGGRPVVQHVFHYAPSFRFKIVLDSVAQSSRVTIWMRT